jgi:hypothetical protein
VLITDTYDDGRMELPSWNDLVACLASEDNATACAAVRDFRRLLDMIELSRLAPLAAEPGMTPKHMSRITGRSVYWLARQGYSSSSSSPSRASSPSRPPSPRVSDGPSLS